MSILLGYEIGTGKAVSIPLAHTAVCGQTQGGKTTTLEALITRSGLRAVAFVTKRDEQSFRENVIHPIDPYFRERADWQFVVAILEACMHQKMNFQRSWIMKLCDGYSKTSGRGTEKTKLEWKAPHKLADVQANCAAALRSARGLNESVYTELNEYLKLVVPEIGRLRYSERLELRAGLNVMDLRRYSTPLQALVISSVLDWVYQRERRVVTVIPESWKFIPKDRGSPVRLAAEMLIREGAASKNFVWVDSQDLAGVHNVILRQCTVWVLGVQRDQHEVKRTLDHIPQSFAKPKRDDVMQLGRGEFFVCYGRECRRVYVQPEWLTDVHAQAIARGEESVESAARVLRETDEPRATFSVEHATPDEKPLTAEGAEIAEETMWKDKYEDLLTILIPGILQQRDDLPMPDEAAKLILQEIHSSMSPAAPVVKSPAVKSASDNGGPACNGLLYQEFRTRLLQEPEVLAVAASRPRLEVKIERPRLELDGKTLRGRLAMMIAEGYFDQPQTGNAAFQELRERRRFPTAKPNVYRELDALTDMGFLLKEPDGYQAVPDMKRSIERR